MRPRPPRALVVASGNRGKVREIRALLAGLGTEVRSLADLGIEPPPEVAPTFVENAIAKARHAAAASGLPALADDSGLVVDALGGAPGVRSARFAGPQASDAENVDRLLEALRGVPGGRRGARFVCVMAFLLAPDHPRPLLAEGVWEGRILEAPRGAGGFGYDPVFAGRGLERSAAELDPAEKNAISHRGAALGVLRRALGAGP